MAGESDLIILLGDVFSALTFAVRVWLGSGSSILIDSILAISRPEEVK